MLVKGELPLTRRGYDDPRREKFNYRILGWFGFAHIHVFLMHKIVLSRKRVFPSSDWVTLNDSDMTWNIGQPSGHPIDAYRGNLKKPSHYSSSRDAHSLDSSEHSNIFQLSKMRSNEIPLAFKLNRQGQHNFCICRGVDDANGPHWFSPKWDWSTSSGAMDGWQWHQLR